MRKIELLSPAKNIDCGIEAIKHGADAVYIGGPGFGARAAAYNAIDDIERLCQFAHIWGARVYVTFNTILYDNELNAAEKTIKQLYNVGVDALIVQDMALLKLDLPPIALHASTQMDNRTIEKARLLEACGFSQIVLARETPLATIKQISNTINTPLEVFVHGALCVSYSGDCYASQYCFNRSANRGECAQFCRMAFDLLNADGKILSRNKHLLSLRDMERSSFIEELMLAGVSSFKIEGRLKDSDYVKNITAHYRKVIDKVIERYPNQFQRSSYGKSIINFIPNISKTFNRGYTDYFINTKRTNDLQNINTPKSVGEEIGIIKNIDKHNHSIDVDLKKGISINAGDGLCFLNSRKELCGCRIERTIGSIIYVTDIKQFKIGTVLYRNFDKVFSKELSKVTARRNLKVDAIFRKTKDGYELKMTDERGYQAISTIQYEHIQACKPQKENIQRQLEKLGDTPFLLHSLEIDMSKDHFIPSSILTKLRRTCTQNLLEIIKANYKRNQRLPIKDNNIITDLLPSRLDYHWNVSNMLSAEFYREHGVKEIQPAFEIKEPTEKKIMNCKYCIRYALNACKKDSRFNHDLWKEPLFLQTGNGNRFLVKFNCIRCEMDIYATNE